MSTGPTPLLEVPQTTTDKVIEFLKIQSPAYWIFSLLSLLATPPDPPPRPLKAYEHPAAAAQFTFQGVYHALLDLGVFHPAAYLGAMAAALVVVSGGALGFVVLWLFQNILPEIASAGLEFIDAFRKDLDPIVPRVSGLVLNELLGGDFNVGDFPGDEDFKGHVARAQVIGNLFIDNFTASVTSTKNVEEIDGQAGAARFAGMIINFGVATALLGLAGELSSAGLFKDFRLIGEQVSSGLGLSKQMRLMLKPIIKTLIATPFQYDLNQVYHPNRFTAAEVVNPFAQTLIDHDLIVKDLELQGWSADRSEQLIKLHQKRLTVDEVETLVRWGHWTVDVATKYVRDLGWPEELVPTLLQLPELKRIDARLIKLIDELETRVADGHMTIDEFVAFIKTLPFTEDERGVIQATAQAKLRTPHKSLTIAEIQSAFDEGLITLDDLDAYFVRLGLTSNDELVLRALTLLKFADLQEAKKVAQFAYDKKVAAAKAKHLPIPPPPAILAG
jgi:hypothetical protein